MTDNSREGLPFMPTVDLSPDQLFRVEGGEVITWAEMQRRRIVTDADDRGDGNEAEGVVTPKPDELAIAVERVTKLADTLVNHFAPDQGASLTQEERTLFVLAVALQTELKPILDRLAAQEETIRADGECLEQIVRDHGLNHTSKWCKGLARARLSAR